MGSRMQERKDEQDSAALEIHRRAGNIEESNTGYNCDNGNQNFEEAYKIASALWRDKDSLVATKFSSHTELTDAVKNCLGDLQDLTMENEGHFERF